MLRELNLNEMEAVSGGDVVATGTQTSDNALSREDLEQLVQDALRQDGGGGFSSFYDFSHLLEGGSGTGGATPDASNPSDDENNDDSVEDAVTDGLRCAFNPDACSDEQSRIRDAIEQYNRENNR